MSQSIAVTNVLNAALVHIFTGKYNIPNGDSFTGMQRFDQATSRILISDVREKRYIRDFFIVKNQLNGCDYEIYVQAEEDYKLDERGITSSYARLKELAEKYGFKIGKGGKGIDFVYAGEMLLKCPDVQLFGGISTADEKKTNVKNAQFTGPVQFNLLNPSLNKVALMPHQNTSVFKSDTANSQGAIATTFLVPFSVNQVVGYVNPALAVHTGLTEELVMDALDASWRALGVCVSRSKIGQASRLLLKINMEDKLDQLVDVENKIQLTNGSNKDLRDISEVQWDFSGLVAELKDPRVRNVQYRVEKSIEPIFDSQVIKALPGKFVKF